MWHSITSIVRQHHLLEALEGVRRGAIQ